MRLISTVNLKSGMILHKDIFINTRTPFVRSETVIDEYLITRLREKEIKFVYIKDVADHENEAVKKTLLSNPSFSINIESIEPSPPSIDTKLQEKSIGSVRDVFAIINERRDKHTAMNVVIELDAVVEQLVDTLEHNKDALVNINALKSYDDYTFHHSLSVAVIAIAIGQHYRFSKAELNRLGLAALMHDIGKTRIPIEILNKESHLTPMELALIRTHPTSAYNYLAEYGIGNERTWLAALHHHERVDGTGYPTGLSGEAIPLYSKIISVADVYDALTSPRPYRISSDPGDALEYIMGSVDTAFDYEAVMGLKNRIELYPVASIVELSNGQIGIVTDNKNQNRPVVKLVDTGDVIDLAHDWAKYNIVIKRICG